VPCVAVSFFPFFFLQLLALLPLLEKQLFFSLTACSPGSCRKARLPFFFLALPAALAFLLHKKLLLPLLSTTNTIAPAANTLLRRESDPAF
jgi:hypothetical protein